MDVSELKLGDVIWTVSPFVGALEPVQSEFSGAHTDEYGMTTVQVTHNDPQIGKSTHSIHPMGIFGSRYEGLIYYRNVAQNKVDSAMEDVEKLNALILAENP